MLPGMEPDRMAFLMGSCCSGETLTQTKVLYDSINWSLDDLMVHEASLGTVVSTVDYNHELYGE